MVIASTLTVSENITLQLLDLKHAAPLLALVQRNQEHLSEWLPWVFRMQTVEDFTQYILQCQQQRREGTDLGYVIFQDKEMIGRLGLHYIQRQNASGAIGYWIDKGCEGKGIITRCCATLVRHCFTEQDFNRIEIRCGTGNSRSAAIPQRLGFTKEGVLRQAEIVNGQFVDLSLYALLKKDWLCQESGPSNG